MFLLYQINIEAYLIKDLSVHVHDKIIILHKKLLCVNYQEKYYKFFMNQTFFKEQRHVLPFGSITQTEFPIVVFDIVISVTVG